MRQRALFAMTLAAAVVAGCSSPTDRWAHEGDSGYYYGYQPIPGTPTLDSLVPGDRRLTVHFHGSAAAYFRTVCRVDATGAWAQTSGASTSPIVADSLQNGVLYACAVWGFNGARVSDSSAWKKATPRAP